MAYTSSALAPRALDFGKTAEATSLPKSFFVVRTVFAQIIGAMMLARTRQAEREITRFLKGAGGKFTDEAEREIERRFLSNQSHW